jgi:sterol desaturase/sphingolipid hydroxylase (fatty acid hydroxylase superfamily)
VLLYFWHRALHETELGWAFHSVHHSGRAFNVSLGVRISWLQRSMDDIVYLPLTLLGFEPLLVLAMVALNRLSQYWVHTEMIGKLSWLDPWLNTPSNHRVHHALQRGGVRANYGSNLMLWDRCFGTYNSERAQTAYGTDAHEPKLNPLHIQFVGLFDYVRRRSQR